MPIYEYECTSHGVFELMRPLSESRQAGQCPACEARCGRILSVPRLAALSKQTRIAHERNEQSRHEPRVVSREPKGAGAGHHAGAKHAHSHQHAARGKGGAVRYTGPRPWVIEHG